MKTTQNHKLYEMALNDHDLLPVIASGSAGTGKTYGACEAAVKWLEKHQGSKVLVTRPNVSFGEALGFLPGDEREKLGPWIRPIQENLDLHGLTYKKQEELEWKHRLTFMPLEYVQGLTWDNTFIILDEAQNMTFDQLMVFLSRTGKWSKVVICGDVAQTSPTFKGSGLAELLDMVDYFQMNVHTINFTRDDIVRSEQCKRWIVALEEWNSYKAVEDKSKITPFKGNQNVHKSH
jgi:phosphate starvation-inducible PhoH-like protein